ncbi:DNA-directed RNA polymerase III subunit RPC5 [Neocloeon triangulifer]|uniref:DNA-directed RNA polymerase III subunit RPC5 n=1 Tax=Neocloeon triangulifer TaxID=2078957 RepID=UPI00286FAEF4|nr:DNA-directed RNA polymerase III subunit RPC5 [Neocloeon triangulifer]
MFSQNSNSNSLTNGTDEDDDPVVQRIPVFLSKASAGQLYLYEYSRNTLINNFEENRVVQSRIKPNQQKVELHVRLDVESKNFNTDLARKLASKTPKSGLDPTKHLIETQVLTSCTAVSKNPGRYAIAVPQSDGIHLNPLAGMVFLKPSYEYLDAPPKRKEQTNKEGEPSASQAKPVGVRFASQSAKRMKLAQSKSMSVHQKLRDEEPWCETEFYISNHFKSITEREKLNCEQTDQDLSSIFCDSADTYLPNLCPPEADDGANKDVAEGVLSAKELCKLPLAEQIKERMKQVHVIKFSRLKYLLSSSASEKEVISGLIRVADLVKGNWVLKSSLLYDKEFASSRGVTADRLVTARDKILLTFTTQETVACKKLTKLTKIPAEDIIEILAKIAFKVSKVGWKFKLDEDKQFIKKHPEVVEQQSRMFETRVKNQEKKDEEEAADAKAAAKKAKAQMRQRKNSTRSRKDSQCSDIGS